MARPARSGFPCASSGKSATFTLSMWLRTSPRVRSNQKSESPVSTRPLSGIGVGSTTSNAEMRSEATISRRSPKPYISRTLPEATCSEARVVSDMGYLQAGKGTVEELVDVAEGRVEVEGAGERVARERLARPRVGLEGALQRAAALPGGEGCALHDLVGLLAREAGAHELEQHAPGEDDAARALEVLEHALGEGDEAGDDEAGAVEDV